MAPLRSASERSARVDLSVSSSRVIGTWRDGFATCGIAIVLDGTVQAIVAAGRDGFTWEVPVHLFGRLLDIVSVQDGESVLDVPIDFSAIRTVGWLGWSLDGRVVRGAFTANVEGAVLPVALVGAGMNYAQGFARLDADRSFAFALTLDRLPPGVDGVAVQPMVGGLVLTPILDLPREAFGYLGFVEPSEPWRVRGWALDLEPDRNADLKTGRPVPLALYLDGRLAATMVADRLRGDVAAAGFAAASGFDIVVPARLDRAVSIDVRVVGGPSLAGSPFLRPAASQYVGYFDVVDAYSAGGWVIDLAAPEQAVEVQAVCDGEVVGVGRAELFRDDVSEAGLPTGQCGFALILNRPAAWLVGRAIELVVAGTALTLRGSPRVVAPNRNAAAFLSRRVPSAPVLERLRRRLTHLARGVTISIIMPVHETRREWLDAAIRSATSQWSDNWELICVDDGSRSAHVGAVLHAAAAADRRVRVLRLPENLGIARAVNFGLRAARGAYVTFLDHDDALEPDAVWHLTEAAQRTGADLLYSDEVLTGPVLDQLIELRARPAWSHDYYLSHPYFVHLVAVRTTMAHALAGYDETMTISADVDFVLRAVERAGSIAHIPRVLYRWRISADSTGQRRRDDVMASTGDALNRHLRRLGSPATSQPGLGFNQYRLDWPDDDGEILIVIPTKDRIDLLRRCIDSIAATAAGARHRIVIVDHESRDPATTAYLRELAERHVVLPFRGAFNFARMNNQAVTQAGGDARYLLFLNNDVEAIASGWLRRLRSLAHRREVGAVGPLLLYGDDRVQHAGVVIGLSGTADHAMRFAAVSDADGARDPGYNASLTSLRDFSAVTAACMMLRRDIFDAAGGFDEGLAVNFNDTDLCLRLRAMGLKVLYDGYTVLRHHESATRKADDSLRAPVSDDRRFRARWPHLLNGRDPFYNPVLSLIHADHRLRDDLIRSDGLAARVSPAFSIYGCDFTPGLGSLQSSDTGASADGDE